jgi:hypothetical protein
MTYVGKVSELVRPRTYCYMTNIKKQNHERITKSHSILIIYIKYLDPSPNKNTAFT